MARSTELSRVAFLALTIAGCGDLPSKSEAIELVRRDVHEDAACTLPIAQLSKFKTQYTTKALCVPRETSAAADASLACLDALAAAGATRRMPARYMAEWPDELTGVAFDAVSPYERRARELLFKGCFEMAGLREGRFSCGEARADKVLRLTKTDDQHATLRYARAITASPQLDAIEMACGHVTRPAGEATVTLEKTDKRWSIVTEPAAP